MSLSYQEISQWADFSKVDLSDCSEHTRSLQRVLLSIQGEGFYPDNSGVHGHQAWQFNDIILNSGSSVLSIVKEGYIPNFKPGVIVNSYFQKNNKSCLDNLPFVYTEVQAWLDQGFIEEVPDQPFCCNPMTVAKKFSVSSGKEKLRLVIDLSRHINKFLIERSHKLDGINNIREILGQDHFMNTFDMKRMYLQYKIHPDFKKFFGFSIPFPDKTRYFIFSSMPFGLAEASFITDTCMKPIKTFLANLGLVLAIYIDDGFVPSPTFLDALYSFKFTIYVILCAGYILNSEKTSFTPKKVTDHLGVRLNTQVQRIFCLPARMDYMAGKLQTFVSRIRRKEKFSARELSSLAGEISFLEISHGIVAKLAARTLHQSLGAAVVKFKIPGQADSIFYDYSVTLRLPSSVIFELQFLLKYLKKQNGQPFRYQNIKMLAKNISCDSYMFEDIDPRDVKKTSKLCASDASASIAFAFVNGQPEPIAEYTFSADEQEMGSSIRELMAVAKAVENMAGDASYANQILGWVTDSACNYFYLKHGARFSAINELVIRIYDTLFSINSCIYPLWKRRSDPIIQIADLGTKPYLDSDDYGLVPNDLQAILTYFDLKIDVDCFASPLSKKSEIFFSKVPARGAAGVDFFSQKLMPNVVYYIHPPVEKIIEAVNHVMSFPNVTAIFIIPIWKHRLFWSYCFNNMSFQAKIKAHFYDILRFQNFQVKTIFDENVRFSTMACHIQT